MPTAVRISEELVDEAKRFSRIDHRSLPVKSSIGRVWESVLRKIRICHICIRNLEIDLDELDSGRKDGIQIRIDTMKIYQSRLFEKKVKKMSKVEKDALDREVRNIAENPNIGEEKKGDLKGVFVHKFKLKANLYLLAYRKASTDLELVMIGSHENYYRDLKSYLKSR